MQFYLMKRVVTYGFKIYPIQKLSEQDKQNIKELTNKYKTSDYH